MHTAVAKVAKVKAKIITLYKLKEQNTCIIVDKVKLMMMAHDGSKPALIISTSSFDNWNKQAYLDWHRWNIFKWNTTA